MIHFTNIPFGLKYESSSNEDKEEEETPILAPLENVHQCEHQLGSIYAHGANIKKYLALLCPKCHFLEQGFVTDVFEKTSAQI